MILINPEPKQLHNPNKKLLHAPKLIYQLRIKMIEGEFPIKPVSGQYFYEKILANIELLCGKKKFTISGTDLLENFYISVSRTFKNIGFVKFKIGYTVHENLHPACAALQMRTGCATPRRSSRQISR